MLVLKVLLGIIGTLCLISLSIYIYLANRGDSITVYSSVDTRLLSAGQKVFLGLAAMGFLTCMYQGAEAMLHWIPKDWGAIDEDGEYQTLQTTIASMFALFGGLTLAQFIDRAAHGVFFLRDLQLEGKELKRIIDASTSGIDLGSLEEEYAKEISALEAKLDARGPLAKTTKRHLLPEGQTIQQYRELVALVHKQRTRIKGALS